jgi:hypothetical protein
VDRSRALKTLAMIARYFHIELEDSSRPVPEHFAFAMMPDGLRVRRRQRTAAQPAPVGECSHEKSAA